MNVIKYWANVTCYQMVPNAPIWTEITVGLRKHVHCLNTSFESKVFIQLSKKYSQNSFSTHDACLEKVSGGGHTHTRPHYPSLPDYINLTS